jgi:hypothetical protein
LPLIFAFLLMTILLLKRLKISSNSMIVYNCFL